MQIVRVPPSGHTRYFIPLLQQTGIDLSRNTYRPITWYSTICPRCGRCPTERSPIKRHLQKKVPCFIALTSAYTTQLTASNAPQRELLATAIANVCCQPQHTYCWGSNAPSNRRRGAKTLTLAQSHLRNNCKKKTKKKNPACSRWEEGGEVGREEGAKSNGGVS